MLIEKALYCAQVKATAGRDIRTVSSDGVLDLTVTRPRELARFGRCGTSPTDGVSPRLRGRRCGVRTP